MMKREIVTMATLSALMLVGFSQTTLAQEGAPIPPGTTEIKAFSIDLTGDAEVPGPGADGSGEAFIVVSPNSRRLCYALGVAGMRPPMAAHIHEGAAGTSGGPVVPFDLSNQGLGGCVTDVDADLLRRINNDPAGFYVNVHNEDFPQGALRGQLRDLRWRRPGR